MSGIKIILPSSHQTLILLSESENRTEKYQGQQIWKHWHENDPTLFQPAILCTVYDLERSLVAWILFVHKKNEECKQGVWTRGVFTWQTWKLAYQEPAAEPQLVKEINLTLNRPNNIEEDIARQDISGDINHLDQLKYDTSTPLLQLFDDILLLA